MARAIDADPPRLDRAADPRLHRLVAGRTGDPRFHILEQEHGLPWWRSLAAQDGAHGREDGPHARACAELRFRWLWPLERPPLKRQSRFRRIPHRNATAARR